MLEDEVLSSEMFNKIKWKIEYVRVTKKSMKRWSSNPRNYEGEVKKALMLIFIFISS